MASTKGRKRKNGPRYPSGKRREARIDDGPTPEFIAKLLQIGLNLDQWDGSVIGVAFAKGIIDKDQHQTATEYSRLISLWRQVVRSTGGPENKSATGILKKLIYGFAKGDERDFDISESRARRENIENALSCLDQGERRAITACIEEGEGIAEPLRALAIVDCYRRILPEALDKMSENLEIKRRGKKSY